ncbi:hypothetical protein [Bermanella sp. R86510]|uniref:hypothetical protein n=1 Tax=unclassified Bermanella TaxID=2627862 RepID=UPI0037CA92FC
MKIALLFISLIFAQFCFSDISVIVNKESVFKNISKEKLKNVYLGESKFYNKSRILPLDQMREDDDTIEFYRALFRKPMSQIVAHWSRLIFTGKGQSPIEVRDQQQMLSLIKANKNMIGYINSELVDDDVFVVMTLKQLP